MCSSTTMTNCSLSLLTFLFFQLIMLWCMSGYSSNQQVFCVCALAVAHTRTYTICYTDPPPPPLYKLRPCRSYSRCTDCINLGP